MQTFFETLATTLEKGEPVVLASLIHVNGTAPNGLGAKFAVSASGQSFGTVGGGSAEYLTQQQANEILKTKTSTVYEHNVREEKTNKGLVCGGQVTIQLQYLDPENKELVDLFSVIPTRYASNQSCYLISHLVEDELKFQLYLGGTSGEVPKEVLLAIDKDPLSFQWVSTAKGRYLIEPLVTGERVLILGTGHVGAATAPIVHSIGFYTHVADDRECRLTKEIVPLAHKRSLISYKDDLKKTLHIGPQDYVIILTRSHAFDYLALEQMLATDAKYIGLMGSRSKLATAKERMLALGYTEEDFGRVHAPIGVSLGGPTPPEIAISIAAELIRVRSGYKKA